MPRIAVEHKKRVRRLERTKGEPLLMTGEDRFRPEVGYVRIVARLQAGRHS